MPRAITDLEGKKYHEGNPDFDKVRIDNLERQVHDLAMAVVDLQHRLSRVDKEDLQWPGDTYEPTYTQPFEG